MVVIHSGLVRRLAWINVLLVVVVVGLMSSFGLFDSGRPVADRVVVLTVVAIAVYALNRILAQVQIVAPLKELIARVVPVSQGRAVERIRIDAWGEVSAACDAVDQALVALDRKSEQLRGQMQRMEHRGGLMTTVLDSMVEGVMVVDQQLAVVYTNSAAARLLDFSSARAITRPLVELGRNARVTQLAREVVSDSETRQIEIDIPRTRRIAQVIATALPGEPIGGCVLVLHDVTDLRRLERMRRDFVSNVSHELKTPLTAIQAFTETLQEGAIDDPRHNRRFLNQIAEQADRLHNQILDLLNLSRIESGAVALDLRPVSLKPLIEQCLAGHREVAQKRGVSLSLVDSGADCQSMVDPREIQTVFENLVSNAIKFTPEGGQVTVRMELEGADVLVHVTDTGEGIAAEHLPRIFERFYRTDKARSRDRGGTGLGLAIVKHLVQALNGSVDVSSRLGHGSTFTVRLPVLMEPFTRS